MAALMKFGIPLRSFGFSCRDHHAVCGGARFLSKTFLKPVTVQRLSAEGLARVAPVVLALAAVEEMPAHAAAVAR